MTSRLSLPGAHLIEGGDRGARQVDDDAREDDERHPVADAALGDLLAEPHDEHRAGREREHTTEAEPPARVVDQRQPAGNVGVPLEPDRDAERLHRCQQQREVARVLRDLAAAQLPLAREALEVGPHHRQQLQDDRRADVRHHPQREDRDPREAAAREHVVEAEHRVLGLLRQHGERLRVHARRGDVVAHPIHREQPEREQHPVAQVGDGEQISQAIDHVRLDPLGSLPPAHQRRPASLPPCR